MINFKSIAVLLTCHNRSDKTLACLTSLYKCISPENHILEVFLVDDGSTDGTAEKIKTQFPSVIIIQGDGNLFWNRGMYLAWKTAARTKNFDYYLWLNDDTILFNNAVLSLIQTSDKLLDKAIVVGSTSSFCDINNITYGGRNKKTGLIQPDNFKPILCDYFNGNIVLIPSLVYKKLGTNDFIFRHALGDFDYGLRASKIGVKTYIAPGTLGNCDAHESLPTWCNPKKSFTRRWTAFRSPLGQNPEEFFIYEKRHNGFAKAVFHYVTNHLRVFLPSLWKFKSN